MLCYSCHYDSLTKITYVYIYIYLKGSPKLNFVLFSNSSLIFHIYIYESDINEKNFKYRKDGGTSYRRVYIYIYTHIY